MRFRIVTLFPELFDSLLATSLVGKAREAGLIDVRFWDPRKFTEDRHHTVDDTPFGGGDGMVLKPDPYVRAIEAACNRSDTPEQTHRPHRVLLCPSGTPIDQKAMARLARARDVVLVCGRYEGFDERIRDFVDEELSLGDFVLNGGEVAAMALIDGISRLVPGVIGNPGSLEDESHSDGLLEYPQYTRPRRFRGREVPEVLLSGDHKRIARWRRQQMLHRTQEKRPALWRRYKPTEADRELLSQLPSGDWRSLSGISELAARCYVALVHHPIYDRQRRIVTTALTNLDLHDIARSSRTYGLGGYFVVTPLESQMQLADRIIAHWRRGHGKEHNPCRSDALSMVDVAPDLVTVSERVAQRHGVQPLIIGTSARRRPNMISRDQLFPLLGNRPGVLVMGTGWGLADSVLDGADAVLEPLSGPGSYNHLSVRSATAIILDRCFSMRD